MGSAAVLLSRISSFPHEIKLMSFLTSRNVFTTHVLIEQARRRR
jgi:hypothetical protein